MNTRWTCGIMLLGLAISTPAFARSHRVAQIPHGASFGCTSCHGTASGGGTFTGFGSSTVGALVGDGPTSGQDIEWAQIYDVDSDRDGFTNGEELGDPDGTWRTGDPNPPGLFFHPGDDSKHPVGSCGDGRVTPPEECDLDNTRGLSCINLGLDPGVLSCDSECLYIKDLCGTNAETPDAGMDTGTQADTGIVAATPDSDEGCSAAGGQMIWAAFMGLMGFRRRRSRTN